MSWHGTEWYVPAHLERGDPTRSVIAVVLASLDLGGAERAGVHLAQGLLDQGLAVDIVVGRASGPLLAELPPVAALVDLGRTRVSRAIPALVTYLRRRQPEAVVAIVTHINLATLIAVGLSRVATRVVVVEQSSMKPMAAQSGRRRDRFALALVRVLYPAAHAVVAVSQGAADEVAAVCPPIAGRLHVVPNPVVTPQLWRRAAEPIAHPWFQAGQPPVVLAVGRLVPEKGFDTLVRGFSHLRRRRSARLLVIGEGPARTSLQDLAAALEVAGDVDLAGQDTNPYRYLAAAAVVASTSTVEGLPTVLIEALALGAIVVATDCHSGPREILDGGRYGTLVPVGDEHALAAALEGALDQAASESSASQAAAGGANPRARARPMPVDAWQQYELGPVATRYVEILDMPAPARRSGWWRPTTSRHSSS